MGIGACRLTPERLLNREQQGVVVARLRVRDPARTAVGDDDGRDLASPGIGAAAATVVAAGPLVPGHDDRVLACAPGALDVMLCTS